MRLLVIFRRQRPEPVTSGGEPAEYDDFDDLASAWSPPTPQILLIVVIVNVVVLAVFLGIRLWPS
jgi:hypothetical protein